MRGAGRWIAETRAGRLLFRVGCLLLVGVVVFVLISEEVGRQTKEITKRFQVIESADPCVTLAQAAEDGAGTKKLKRLTAACTGFLDGLGPLISQRLACDILERGSYPCPRPGSPAAVELREGGDASQPAPAAGQQPEPGRPGGKDGSPAPGNRGDKQPKSPPNPPPGRSERLPAPPSAGSSPPPAPVSEAPAPPADPPGRLEGAVEGVEQTACALAPRLPRCPD